MKNNSSDFYGALADSVFGKLKPKQPDSSDMRMKSISDLSRVQI